MKGLIVINGYPSSAKFWRQGERIASELALLGIPTDVKRNGEVYALVEEGGQVCVELGDGYDFAVYLDKDKYLGRMLEQKLRLFNSAEAVELCDDKMSTYLALLDKGVPLAKSIPSPLCYTQGATAQTDFLKKVGEALGYPVVAKKSYGSFGAGVVLVKDFSQLCEIEGEWLHVPHFYQQYIAPSAGKDIRVIVVGGKVVGSMERVAKAGEFRSNIELGGEGRRVELSPAFAEVAERAARALKLDYCGVDLLEGEDGPIVCEVNSNAFFEGLEGVTGLNIARSYAEYIRAELAKTKN